MAVSASAFAVAVSAQRAGTAPTVRIVQIPYADARSAIAAYPEKLPPALRGKSPGDVESTWPSWVSQHNSEIRARLRRGDEDSLVNFWLYGTSFTKLPRASEREVATLDRGKIAELLEKRLDDLVSALANPGTNERLRFARRVIDDRGINIATVAGQDQARAYLIEIRSRVMADNERYKQAAQTAAGLNRDLDKLAAFSTMFSDRGLSSDTSLRPGFAVETTLSAMKASGRLGEVRRLGIIGPGLDFSDKAEGFDFYPQQTIQPFALIDSLIRLGMARATNINVVTFDLSPRVNQHLDAARRKAQAGQPYVLQLPIDMKDPAHEWSADLVSYWRRLGDRIGVGVPALAPPRGGEGVQVRAVSIRPAVVTAIQPRDVNIVLERTDDEPFDLIVATNILVYYDSFEQALALANIAHLLRPGGFFLTNYAVSPLTPMEPEASLSTPVFWDRQGNGDTLFWYQRR
jgi:SAM-dependent methyltransferase